MAVTTRIGKTSASPDLLRDIHDMDERELAAASKRWVELSELVAPVPDGDPEPEDATEPAR